MPSYRLHMCAASHIQASVLATPCYGGCVAFMYLAFLLSLTTFFFLSNCQPLHQELVVVTDTVVLDEWDSPELERFPIVHTPISFLLRFCWYFVASIVGHGYQAFFRFVLSFRALDVCLV